ncbi:MAG TPA: hydrogenase small subunit [Candidatus Bipolaricaulota bacterium]
MKPLIEPLSQSLARSGFGRREFLKYCAATATLLGLPDGWDVRLAHALETAQKPVLLWLEFQECGGCSESLLRAADPSIESILLEKFSLNYHSLTMAAAGHQAEAALWDTVASSKGQYIALIEGSIPSGAGGFYAASGGRSALEVARQVCANAKATIAVGSCASFGGWPAAKPNPTGAQGVEQAVPGIELVNLPGCPPNAANIAATLVNYLALGRLPSVDAYKRPTFAYGENLHDNCERHDHFKAKRFVEAWGDQGHRLGWCLLKMGCKGPVASHNCPRARWNQGTSWPVAAGHGCIGCSEPRFWDELTSFYKEVPTGGGGGRNR